MLVIFKKDWNARDGRNNTSQPFSGRSSFFFSFVLEHFSSDYKSNNL